MIRVYLPKRVVDYPTAQRVVTHTNGVLEVRDAAGEVLAVFKKWTYYEAGNK